MTYKHVDLFCGGGGFAYGAKCAGAQVVLCVDMEQSFEPVIERHFGPNVFFKYTIDFDNMDILRDKIQSVVQNGDAWHLHASPPCNDVSGINSQSKDDRALNTSKLAHSLVQLKKLVCALKPTTYSFENVAHAKASFLKAFPNDFSYEYDTMDLQGFGTLSSRRRIIMVRDFNEENTLKTRMAMQYAYGYCCYQINKGGQSTTIKAGLPSGVAYSGEIPREYWGRIALKTNSNETLSATLRNTCKTITSHMVTLGLYNDDEVTCKRRRYDNQFHWLNEDFSTHISFEGAQHDCAKVYAQYYKISPFRRLLLSGFPKEYEASASLSERITCLCVPPPTSRAVLSAAQATLFHANQTTIQLEKRGFEASTAQLCCAASCVSLATCNHPYWGKILPVCHFHKKQYNSNVAFDIKDDSTCHLCCSNILGMKDRNQRRKKKKDTLIALDSTTVEAVARTNVSCLFQCSKCNASLCAMCLYRNFDNALTIIQGNLSFTCTL